MSGLAYSLPQLRGLIRIEEQREAHLEAQIEACDDIFHLGRLTSALHACRAELAAKRLALADLAGAAAPASISHV